MELLKLENWPLLFISLAMIASGVVDWWIHKVPNRLTFPLIISGWLLGLVHNFGGNLLENGQGGIGTSFACTMLGFALMWPLYALGMMGGGDGKMVMAFGAWAGAFFYPLRTAVEIVFFSFALGVIVGGILGAIMIVMRRNFKQNLANVRVFLLSFVSSDRFSQGSAKRKAVVVEGHKLAYGVPLCIGFAAYLYYLAINGQLRTTL
jgi:prepilin peptidase CpaA